MKTQDIKNMASAYMQVLESENVKDLEEISKKTLGSYIKKAASDIGNSAEAGNTKKELKRHKGIAKAADKLTKEEKKAIDKVKPSELQGTHAQRKDKDIDNDGDVDSSDEYLHNRRKAVSKAMKKEAKDYGPGHIGAIQKMLDKEREAKKAKDAMKKEEVELDEAQGTAAKYAGKSGILGGKYTSHDRMMDMKNFNAIRDKRAKQRDAEHQKQDPKHAKAGYAQHMVDTDKAKKKAYKRGVDASHLNWRHASGLKQESTQIDEDITKMSHGRLKFHMNNKHIPHGSYSWDQMKAERDRRLKAGQGNEYKAAKSSMSEEVQLDEADKSLAHANQAARHDQEAKKHKVAMMSAYSSKDKKKVNYHKQAMAAHKEASDSHKDAAEEHRQVAKYGHYRRLRNGLRTADHQVLSHVSATANDASKHAYSISKKMNEEAGQIDASVNDEVRWPVLQRIMEKAGGREDHVKGAATAEPIDSKASGAEKDFVNQHGGLDGNDSGIDGAKAAAETAKNIAASVKPGPKRPADRTEGDKKSPE